MQRRLTPIEIHAQLRERYESRRRGFEEQLLEDFAAYLQEDYGR